MKPKGLALALHGGAGTILRSQLSPEQEQAYTQALQTALDQGWQILEKGGSALDAVEQTVAILEDCPLFNAGRGSVFTAQGQHEMDASIMQGQDRKAGAVAGIQGIKNPIALARRVMEASEHVFLMGQGAQDFAQKQGFETLAPEYFFDAYRHQQWLALQGSEQTALDHSPDLLKDHKFGTVGAVARDAQGDLAAATSTGGMTNKRFGRVGDSPIIGAGNYADNTSCAVSCTGSGEFFIRAVAAYDVACLMKYRACSLAEACRLVVHEHLMALGGDGGLIAVDYLGNLCLDFNTEGMYRAWRNAQGQGIGIYS